MLRIELRFPAGRYHATPWGQHVNEGAVEWPPSPWRLLRAVVATWYAKASEEVAEDELAAIVEALSQELPHYTLPEATASHTRHYMPLGKLEKGVERTAKILDTFVQIDRQASLRITWQTTTLSDEQATKLELLLSRMSYLGRAESWVEFVNLGRSDGEPSDSVFEDSRVLPLTGDQLPGSDQELVRVLCPRTSAEIAAWRARQFEQHLEQLLAQKKRRDEEKGKDPSKTKLSKKDKESIDAMYPKGLLEALHVDTGDLHKQGWSEAPGTQWVDYVRPRDALSGARRSGTRHRSTKVSTVARFALAGQVPPRLTHALYLAVDVRKCLMSLSGADPVFSGKTSDGEPRRGNQHTFVLPEAYEGGGEHGRVSHVTLYAPMGFDDAAREAIQNVRRLWSKHGHPQQLVLLGMGKPEDFAGDNTEAGQCPLFSTSSTWVSRTPFVPTRHAKFTRAGVEKKDDRGMQIGSPEHDLCRLLVEAGHPEPESVERLESTILGGKPTPWLQFKTVRKDGDGARASNHGFGFRVRFPHAVTGPIAVGYGAHFGLGVFVTE